MVMSNPTKIQGIEIFMLVNVTINTVLQLSVHLRVKMYRFLYIQLHAVLKLE